MALTLVSPHREALAEAARRAEAAVGAHARLVKPVERLGPEALDLEVEGDRPAPLRATLAEALGELPVDACVQPAAGRRKRLFVADMDSTVIGCECLDELADYAGVKDRVAAITERAMRGEIAFEAALRERVAMLAGQPQALLERCYRERVRLNPGARALVRTLAENGVRTVLVSGGFEAFTARVGEVAGFDAHQANRLRTADGRLTGEVDEPILGREAKLQALQAQAAALHLDARDTLAVGDGANDLAMIGAAGLGVAYRAKPVVAAQAHARVDHADLTALLYFQGYRREAFAPD